MGRAIGGTDGGVVGDDQPALGKGDIIEQTKPLSPKHLCICVLVGVHVCVRACAGVHMYVRADVWACMCVGVHMYVRAACGRARVHMCVRAYVRAYVRACICVRVRAWM